MIEIKDPQENANVGLTFVVSGTVSNDRTNWIGSTYMNAYVTNCQNAPTRTRAGSRMQRSRTVWLSEWANVQVRRIKT